MSERVDIDGEWFDPEVRHFAFPASRQIGEVTSLRRLPELAKLTSASFAGTNLDDEGLQYVCRAATLELLDLQDTCVTNAGLECLARLPGLQTLRLKDNLQLTDECVVHLSRLRALTDLQIQETSITEVGLSRLHVLSNLREVCLEVWDDNFSFAGLLRLSQRMAACTFLAKSRGVFRAAHFEGRWGD